MHLGYKNQLCAHTQQVLYQLYASQLKYKYQLFASQLQ